MLPKKEKYPYKLHKQITLSGYKHTNTKRKGEV